MAHLLDYEEAEEKAEENPTRENFVAASLAALTVTERKNSKRLAWNWADTAIRWAEKADIADAADLVGNRRWPNTDKLRARLEG